MLYENLRCSLTEKSIFFASGSRSNFDSPSFSSFVDHPIKLKMSFTMLAIVHKLYRTSCPLAYRKSYTKLCCLSSLWSSRFLDSCKRLLQLNPQFTRNLLKTLLVRTFWQHRDQMMASLLHLIYLLDQCPDATW